LISLLGLFQDCSYGNGSGDNKEVSDCKGKGVGETDMAYRN